MRIAPLKPLRKFNDVDNHLASSSPDIADGLTGCEEQMPIDIDALSEPELVDLNHRIVERLRFLHQIHAHQAMLKFSIGDRVTFEDGQGRKVEGTLTRYNRKSVTVIGADGRHWNIAPGFLRKADQAAASKTPNIIALPKR